MEMEEGPLHARCRTNPTHPADKLWAISGWFTTSQSKTRSSAPVYFVSNTVDEAKPRHQVSIARVSNG